MRVEQQGSPGRGPHKRRQFLVARRFQLKWTLAITLAGTVTAVLFGSLLWLAIMEQNVLIAEASRVDVRLRKQSQDVVVLLLNMSQTTAAEATAYKKRFAAIGATHQRSQQTKAALRRTNERARYWIVSSVIAIGTLLFIWGILLTHKVAGPLFVIRKQLLALSTDGRLPQRPLRKGDDLQDLYELFSTTIDGLLAARMKTDGPPKEVLDEE